VGARFDEVLHRTQLGEEHGRNEETIQVALGVRQKADVQAIIQNYD